MGAFKIKLHVAEVFVSENQQLASVVINGIDTPAMFMPQSGAVGTPEHLTLWGHPPVMAGRSLIGLPLTLRTPYMQVTAECLQNSLRLMGGLLDELRLQQQDSRGRFATIQSDLAREKRTLRALRQHSTIVDALLISKTIRLQAMARSFFARRAVGRVKRSGMAHWQYIRSAK